MSVELTALEARIVGCLIEKQITTPDQYPLSLNALTNACNQKSNRDPVLNLHEREVQAVVDALARKQLLMEKSGFGSRVPKFHHLFCNTQFGSLKFTPEQTAIVCELLLRGPQTPGELRGRVPRMAALADPGDIEAALQALATRAAGAMVVRLAREPGRRDACWAQLFTGPVEAGEDAPAAAAPAPLAAAPSPEPGPALVPASDDRLARLEAEVRALRAEVEELKRGG